MRTGHSGPACLCPQRGARRSGSACVAGYFTACPCGIVDSAQICGFSAGRDRVSTGIATADDLFRNFNRRVNPVSAPAPQARMPQLEGINSSHPPVCNLASHETPGRFARVYQNHPVITARVLAVGGVGGVGSGTAAPVSTCVDGNQSGRCAGLGTTRTVVRRRGWIP